MVYGISFLNDGISYMVVSSIWYMVDSLGSMVDGIWYEVYSTGGNLNIRIQQDTRASGLLGLGPPKFSAGTADFAGLLGHVT